MFRHKRFKETPMTDRDTSEDVKVLASQLNTVRAGYGRRETLRKESVRLRAISEHMAETNGFGEAIEIAMSVKGAT